MGIGDPGLGGWLIVAFYAVTGLLALRVAIGGVFPERSARRERLFWGALGIGMLLLALNKQLDLQTLLTAAARCMAQLQGWYETPRIVQVGFIAGIFVLMVLLFGAACMALRGTLHRNGLAIAGLVFVLGFVLIRAAGFHHMDRLISIEVHSIRLNWVLEMAGPLCISGGALLILRGWPKKR